VVARGLIWDDVRDSRCCPTAKRKSSNKADLGTPLMDVPNKRRKKPSAAKGTY
jgi:hypothetical protein